MLTESIIFPSHWKGRAEVEPKLFLRVLVRAHLWILLLWSLYCMHPLRLTRSLWQPSSFCVLGKPTSLHRFISSHFPLLCSGSKSMGTSRSIMKGSSRSFSEPAPSLHVLARGPYPGYPERAVVPDDKVPWAVSFDGYSPIEYTSEKLLSNPHTDPQDTSSINVGQIWKFGVRLVLHLFIFFACYRFVYCSFFFFGFCSALLK